MPFEYPPPPVSFPPADEELVNKIVTKLKAQGTFDQFRKDCLADVDTKPAYQNLQQRVNSNVAKFLAEQNWQPDMNKIQLRETLRKHLQQGFLETGLDRIVDQVVNPKIAPCFLPKVEDAVYETLGIEKPKIPLSASIGVQFLTSFPPPMISKSNISNSSDGKKSSDNPAENETENGGSSSLKDDGKEKSDMSVDDDLLPKDLDPVSPENLSVNGGETPTLDERNDTPTFDEKPRITDVQSHDSPVPNQTELSGKCTPTQDEPVFSCDTPTMDEKPPREGTPTLANQSSKLEEESQVSGISELSSHLGDTFQVESNTAKCLPTPNKTDLRGPKFDNFSNLSEKIKEVEKAHGQVTGHTDVGVNNSGDIVPIDGPLNSLNEKEGNRSPPPESKNEEFSLESSFKKEDSILSLPTKEDIPSNKGEVVSDNSLSTFDDSKQFSTKFQNEESCSRPFSEDSFSVSARTTKPSTPTIQENIDIKKEDGSGSDAIDFGDIKNDLPTTPSKSEKDAKPVESQKDHNKSSKSRDSSGSRHSSSKCSDSKNKTDQDEKGSKLREKSKEPEKDKLQKSLVDPNDHAQKETKDLMEDTNDPQNDTNEKVLKEDQEKLSKEEKDTSLRDDVDKGRNGKSKSHEQDKEKSRRDDKEKSRSEGRDRSRDGKESSRREDKHKYHRESSKGRSHREDDKQPKDKEQRDNKEHVLKEDKSKIAKELNDISHKEEKHRSHRDEKEKSRKENKDKPIENKKEKPHSKSDEKDSHAIDKGNSLQKEEKEKTSSKEVTEKSSAKDNKEGHSKSDENHRHSSKGDRERKSSYKDEKDRHSSKDKHTHRDEESRSKDRHSSKDDKSKSSGKSEKDKLPNKDTKEKSSSKHEETQSSSVKEEKKIKEESSVPSKEKQEKAKSFDKSSESDSSSNKEPTSDSGKTTDQHHSSRDKSKERNKTDRASERSREREKSGKEKNEKDRSRDRGEHKKKEDKYEKDKNADKIKTEKDRLNDRHRKEGKPIGDKTEHNSKEEKVKDSSDSKSHSQSSKTSHKSKDEKSRSDKQSTTKSDEDKKDRKRKGERCNDDRSVKEARRSSDRDSSGRKGGSSHRSHSGSGGSSSTREQKRSDKKPRESRSSETPSSQEQAGTPADRVTTLPSIDMILSKLSSDIKESEKSAEPDDIILLTDDNDNTPDIAAEPVCVQPQVSEPEEEPSSIDAIIKKLNSSIEELESSQNETQPNVCSTKTEGETPAKKPRFARNISEVKKIMEARRNLERLNRSETKLQEPVVGPIVKPVVEPVKEEEAEIKMNSNELDFLGFTLEEASVLKTNIIDNIEYQRSLIDAQSSSTITKPTADESNLKLLGSNDDEKLIKSIVNGKKGCYVLLKNLDARSSPSLAKQLGELSLRQPRTDSPAAPVDPMEIEGAQRVAKALAEVQRRSQDEPGTSQQPSSPFSTVPVHLQDSPDSPIVESMYEVQEEEEDSPVLSDEENVMSTLMTEDMLKNLMKESMLAAAGVESPEKESKEESLEERRDTENTSMEESISENVSPAGRKEECQGAEPRGKRQPRGRLSADKKGAAQAVYTPVQGKQRTSNTGTLKQHNTRVARSTQRNQRYDSSDLYKPRPVLNTNTKRRAAISDFPNVPNGRNLKEKSDLSEPVTKRKRR